MRVFKNNVRSFLCIHLISTRKKGYEYTKKTSLGLMQPLRFRPCLEEQIRSCKSRNDSETWLRRAFPKEERTTKISIKKGTDMKNENFNLVDLHKWLRSKASFRGFANEIFHLKFFESLPHIHAETASETAAWILSRSHRSCFNVIFPLKLRRSIRII